MAHRPSLPGLHVPLVTPFTADGRVAITALAELADSVLDAGATGIVALGTTAEVATLDADEKTAVVDVCAQVCRERKKTLIVGAGGNNTRASAAALAGLARWPETTAALVPVPAFTRPGAAGVLAHFAQLAGTSPVPLIVYHVPLRTGQMLDAKALRALGELPGVSGIKLAGGQLDEQTVALLADLPADFAVLAGDDQYVFPLLALGAVGGIVASAHLATEHFVDLVTTCQQGDLGRARNLGRALFRLAAAAFSEPNPTVIKGVLHEQGRIPTPDVRLPLLPAEGESVAKVLAELDTLANLRPR
ncbi:MAG TPA: dihydrodipicolinate synthase family protein [Pseudonocardiaceae bacterium]|jgi:4-hydroxy-tetrahydrodipicolinate synthase|nr:dihydrodipicolinate synthase family protein [Pseudonocardiaceae bacterium]